MSVDVAAKLASRVSLAAVLEQARNVLRALLGLDSEPPELVVISSLSRRSRYIASFAKEKYDSVRSSVTVQSL